MRTKLKITVSSVKYGNHNPEGTNPDLYINEKSAYNAGTEKQNFTLEKVTDRFLCALIEESDEILKSSEMKGLETFERCDKKIVKEDLNLEDSISLISDTIQDLVDINASEKGSPHVSYLALYLDGEYGVCVNNGLQSAYYYDSINMISMTPMAKNPDKLIKMGVISDEQADLVREDILKAASQIHISKPVRLIKEGIFILMNTSMAEYFDELDVENCIESLREPEPIANFLMEEAVYEDANKDYSVTVIKIDYPQCPTPPKKKVSTEKTKTKSVPPKTEKKEEKKAPSTAKKPDEARTIRIPDINEGRYAGITDAEEEADQMGATRKVEPLKKKPGEKSHVLAYFTSRIFTIIVIIAFLSGVVIGLVHLASLVFSDNVVPPVHSENVSTDDIETGGKTTTKKDETKETTTNAVTSGGTTVSGGTVTSTPQYTMPPITEEEIIHTVKSGETLSHISMLYYNDQNKYHLIMEANNISDPTKLQIGQKLIIPPLPKETTSATTTTGD